jgi:hypothetical protein
MRLVSPGDMYACTVLKIARGDICKVHYSSTKAQEVHTTYKEKPVWKQAFLGRQMKHTGRKSTGSCDDWALRHRAVKNLGHKSGEGLKVGYSRVL